MLKKKFQTFKIKMKMKYRNTKFFRYTLINEFAFSDLYCRVANVFNIDA